MMLSKPYPRLETLRTLIRWTAWSGALIRGADGTFALVSIAQRPRSSDAPSVWPDLFAAASALLQAAVLLVVLLAVAEAITLLLNVARDARGSLQNTELQLQSTSADREVLRSVALATGKIDRALESA